MQVPVTLLRLVNNVATHCKLQEVWRQVKGQSYVDLHPIKSLSGQSSNLGNII